MSVDIEPFSLPLSRPLETASGTIERREGFVVRTTIDGTEGVGEATPLSGWTESLAACERALEAVTDPRSALKTDALRDTPAARHGLSLAVLDASARAENRPLYRYLGGTERTTRVPVNATVGDGSPAETASAVEDAVEDGYPAVKLKLGVGSPSTDIERIEAVRARCPDVELRTDLNGSWTFDIAVRFLPALADLDISIVEQPLPATALADHARLRGRGVDIALDESLVEHGHEAVLAADAADLLVCKPMALGGVDLARDAIGAARTAGADAVVTTTIDGAIARIGAVHLAASVSPIRACGLATARLLESDLDVETPRTEDGVATVPQGKGNIPWG